MQTLNFHKFNHVIEGLIDLRTVTQMHCTFLYSALYSLKRDMAFPFASYQLYFMP